MVLHHLLHLGDPLADGNGLKERYRTVERVGAALLHLAHERVLFAAELVGSDDEFRIPMIRGEHVLHSLAAGDLGQLLGRIELEAGEAVGPPHERSERPL